MRISSRPGEANVPAIILSVAVLVLFLAGAYYLLAVVPSQSSGENSSSPSSASSVILDNDGATTDDDSSSSVQLTAEQRAAYDACINAATEAHTQRWKAACDDKRNTQETLFLGCMQKQNDEEYCNSQFGGYENIGDNCDLGTLHMTTLNSGYTAAKQSCNRQYGL